VRATAGPTRTLPISALGEGEFCFRTASAETGGTPGSANPCEGAYPGRGYPQSFLPMLCQPKAVGRYCGVDPGGAISSRHQPRNCASVGEPFNKRSDPGGNAERCVSSAGLDGCSRRTLALPIGRMLGHNSASSQFYQCLREIIDGGEGGIRTPDTVARMPHFECGAFNRSATSPRMRGLIERRASYLAATVNRNKTASRADGAGAPSPSSGRRLLALPPRPPADLTKCRSKRGS
jgi:hypothetical protein